LRRTKISPSAKVPYGANVSRNIQMTAVDDRITLAVPHHSGNDLPLLMTVAETAQLLRTTKSGIYAMVERVQLPGVTRIGRRVLIRSDVLLEWLDQNRAPSPRARIEHSAAETLTRRGK
jgi:excisionase family DNA binding protein